MFVGDDAPDDTKGLLYYLRSAAGDTPRQKVDFVSRNSTHPPADVDLLDARLVVVGAALPTDVASKLRRWAESGGTVLWVLKDVATAQAVAPSIGTEASEAPGSNNFALLARVDLEHPLFAPFADARFGDFTKIHFWHHRRIKLNPGGTARVLAWFDDGDPFLIEMPSGKGRLLIATSGWHPADSQLALSTKFVPLISGLLRGPERDDAESTYAVTEPIRIPQPTTQPTGAAPAITVVTPDGRRIDVPAGSTTFDGADRPGIYRVVRAGQETPLAVNLAPDESRTAPLAPEELEHWGAKLGTRPASDELAARHRQLQIIELENRQKLWRWLIVCVLGLVGAETALAGRLARRGRRSDDAQQQPQQVVTT